MAGESKSLEKFPGAQQRVIRLEDFSDGQTQAVSLETLMEMPIGILKIAGVNLVLCRRINPTEKRIAMAFEPVRFYGARMPLQEPEFGQELGLKWRTKTRNTEHFPNPWMPFNPNGLSSSDVRQSKGTDIDPKKVKSYFVLGYYAEKMIAKTTEEDRAYARNMFGIKDGLITSD